MLGNPVHFLGHDIDYWLELDAWATMQSVDNILAENARLRVRVQQLEHGIVLDNVDDVQPEYKVAVSVQALRKLVRQEVNTYIATLFKERT